MNIFELRVAQLRLEVNGELPDTLAQRVLTGFG